MEKRKLLKEYLSRIKSVAFLSCDGDYQLRCHDAEKVFESFLDDLLYQEYMHSERKYYDFWDTEIEDIHG